MGARAPRARDNTPHGYWPTRILQAHCRAANYRGHRAPQCGPSRKHSPSILMLHSDRTTHHQLILLHQTCPDRRPRAHHLVPQTDGLNRRPTAAVVVMHRIIHMPHASRPQLPEIRRLGWRRQGRPTSDSRAIFNGGRTHQRGSKLLVFLSIAHAGRAFQPKHP